MSSLKRAVAIVAVLVASAGVLVITGSPASAALPYCNNVSGISDDSAGLSRYLTYVSSGNYTLNCDMNGLNENGNAGQRRAIKQIQWDLIKCYGQNIAYDGEYGPNTRQAVKNVQAYLNTKGAGLVVDGWAGPKTRKAMKHVAIEETFCARVSNPVFNVFTIYELTVPDSLSAEQRRYTP